VEPGAAVAAKVLSLLLVGLAFGVLTSAVNHGFGPYPEHTSEILGDEWTWLTAGFLAAWVGHAWMQSVVRACAVLVPAVLVYYISDLMQGTYTNAAMRPGGGSTIDLPGLFVDVVFYTLLAVVTATVLGLLVSTIRRGGLMGILAALALPVYIARTVLGAATPLHEVSGYVGIAAAGLMAVIALVALGRRRGPNGSLTRGS
jgi:hypothetical protein